MWNCKRLKYKVTCCELHNVIYTILPGLGPNCPPPPCGLWTCPVPCPKNRHEKVKQVWNCKRLKYKVTCCELHNVIYTNLPGLGPNCPPPPCGLWTCPVPCAKNRHEKVKQVWNCKRLKYKVTCCELHNVIYTNLPGLGPNCPPPPCGLWTCPVPCPKNRHEKVKQVWNCKRLKYKVTCCELHNVIYTILPGLGPNCPPPPCGLWTCPVPCAKNRHEKVKQVWNCKRLKYKVTCCELHNVIYTILPGLGPNCPPPPCGLWTCPVPCPKNRHEKVKQVWNCQRLKYKASCFCIKTVL